MNKRTINGIDVSAPGGIAALMDFHRLTFGDAVMEDLSDAEKAAAQELADKEAKDAADAAALMDTDAGKRALQSERDARAAEKVRADAAEAKLQAAEDAKLSDIDKANKAAADAATENATLKADNARLAALASYPVPKDYQDLVTGTDAATYEASAKKISELYARAEGKAPKGDPVHGSGDRSGDDNPTGGSIAAGRDAYALKHPKKS